MLADRLRDDPAAVLELLEQTTSVLMERQAGAGSLPRQKGRVPLPSDQFGQRHASPASDDPFNVRPATRPATAGKLPPSYQGSMMPNQTADKFSMWFRVQELIPF